MDGGRLLDGFRKRGEWFAQFRAIISYWTERVKSRSALSAKHGIDQTMIAAWKCQVIEGPAPTFFGKAEAIPANSEAGLPRLYANIVAVGA